MSMAETVLQLVPLRQAAGRAGFKRRADEVVAVHARAGQGAEHQALAAHAAEVRHEFIPNDFRLERVPADQLGLDVLFDHQLGGLAADLMVGYAKALDPVVRRNPDDREADGLNLSCRIRKAARNRPGYKMHPDIPNLTLLHIISLLYD